MPQTAVVGTSLAGMILPSLTGLLKHARLQNVDWLMAAGLSAGRLCYYDDGWSRQNVDWLRAAGLCAGRVVMMMMMMLLLGNYAIIF